MSAFKDILNMIFPNKADKAYSLLTNFLQSGEERKSYTFYGKTITLYASPYSTNVSYTIKD